MSMSMSIFDLLSHPTLSFLLSLSLISLSSFLIYGCEGRGAGEVTESKMDMDMDF
jgi:hypothetical protein